MQTKQSNWPAGIKRTKQRESVLSILEHSKKPLSVSDICSKMKSNENTAWISTVYRTLSLFVEKGIIIKTVINSEMAVYELNRSQHKHYAVCTNCHKIIEMQNCPMENFTPKLEDSEFQVAGHNLELFGLCGDCISKK